MFLHFFLVIIIVTASPTLQIRNVNFKKANESMVMNGNREAPTEW